MGSGLLHVGLGHYLTVSAMLFTLGIFGIFLNRKNLIVILMSIFMYNCYIIIINKK